MKVRVEDAALQEIQDAVGYLQMVAPQSGEDFLNELATARKLVIEHPNAHPKAGLGCRRILLSNHPYQLVYRAEGDTIVIYAVAHLARRPRYWKGRIG